MMMMMMMMMPDSGQHFKMILINSYTYCSQSVDSALAEQLYYQLVMSTCSFHARYSVR